ncbi:MAG: ComEC/Rec2 family competence protein [Thermoleophilia bacterium]|nr:ComEC/Rec2 family competence protein [Thermoleophilia bacterium]
MRRVVEQHWPSLLVGAACAGLVASNVVSVPDHVLALAGCLALAAVALLTGRGRVVAVGAALVIAGLWWGGLRLDAMASSALSHEIGESASAELVVVGPARTTSWAVRVQADVRRFAESRVRERVLLLLPVGRSPPRGAILETVVRVTEPREPEGGFDERAWLARQGIHVVLRGGTWRQIGTRGGIAGVGDRLRDRVERAVGRGVGGVRRALVLGVVLGEDEGLSSEIRDDFRASGLYHLLAVSGQNVAFLALGIYGLGWLLRLPRVARELATMGGIGLYVLAVGWQPSVVRAGVAGALASLAWLVARPRDRWHFLALGALVLLVWAPTSVFEPGFQLSFAAVAGIFVGVPRVRDRLRGYPLPTRLAEVLGVAVVCGVVTAPIVLLHFGQAPLYTVPANVLAEPAVPLVLGLGLLAGAVDPFAPGVAAALGWLAGWAAAWLELVARLVASLPSAQIGAKTALAGALALAAVWLGLSRATRRSGARRPVLAVVLGGAVVVAIAGWWAVRPAPTWHQPTGLRVTFLDVGQGDSVLLETPSARVLVDQGPPEADVAGQLARMGIRGLSALVLTHPQRDHVGGAGDVIRQLRVGAVLDPGLAATGPDREEAVAAARERRVPIHVVRAGSEFKVGGLLLRAVWPPDAGGSSEDPNLNALVLVATYGETDVLLTADAESDVTASLPLSGIEILKVAHHGSADPGLDDELRVLRPRIAVISCGRNNDYGHPRAETLAALAASPGITVYRTDLDGRVVVESDGRQLRVRTHG